MNIQLSLRQTKAFEGLAIALERGQVACLRGRESRGKSTVLRALFSRTGGAYLSAREYIEAGLARDPLALEETLFAFVINKMERGSDYVYLDDLGGLTALMLDGEGHYPRRGYFELTLKALCEQAVARGRKLIFEEGAYASREVAARAFPVEIGAFTAEDYAFLGGRWLGPGKAEHVNFHEVFQYAPRLDAHQLNAACQWMFFEKNVNTGTFLERIRTVTLRSNVDLDKIAPVDLRQIEGVEEVVRGLAAQLVLPLENDPSVKGFALRPKRGVVLHGPAGTGKTTIGRALAHRLKSKLLAIDAGVLTGAADYRAELDPVLELARLNAPVLILIDGADTLFAGAAAGACRYLLARLDGVENQTGAAVSLLVTAREPRRLPVELTTCGRLESWMETRLPTAAGRGRLFEEQVARLGESLRGGVDPQPVLAASEGFSAAEIQCAVEEAGALCAFDKLQNQPLRDGTKYLLDGVERVAESRRRAAVAGDGRVAIE